MPRVSVRTQPCGTWPTTAFPRKGLPLPPSPPLARGRLSERPDGRDAFQVKHPWQDGTSLLLLSGVEPIGRLAAPVLSPRQRAARYFGILAPNAKLGPLAVPKSWKPTPHRMLHPERRHREKPPQPADPLGSVSDHQDLCQSDPFLGSQWGDQATREALRPSFIFSANQRFATLFFGSVPLPQCEYGRLKVAFPGDGLA